MENKKKSKNWKKNLKDNLFKILTIFIGCGAIIISVRSCIHSDQTIQEAKDANEISEEALVLAKKEFIIENIEILSLDCKLQLEDYEVDLIVYPRAITIILPVCWECVLSNNGKQTSSIIDYFIFEFEWDDLYSYSSGIHTKLGLYTNENELKFPINLLSGESIKFDAYAGIMLDSIVSKSLIKNLPRLNNLSHLNILYYLSKDSIGLFGNKLTEFGQLGEKLNGYSKKMSISRQYNFKFEMKTGKYNYAETILYFGSSPIPSLYFTPNEVLYPGREH